MKKIAYYSLLSSLLLFIMGCTLSMDEWVETEEQKGYNEVETIENDFYTLQYEYKKSTRSLTEDIQKYIVQIEADSILYFMDNTPSDWLPKAGGQVVANCCPMFPMGYMGKVLSVERQNGLVKVVTTDANLEDCFEDFDFEFAGDIYTSNPDDENQDADTIPGVRERFTRASADGQGTEIVIRDWTMYNDMLNGGGKLTRTSLEDVYKEDIDNTDTKTSDVIIFDVSLGGKIGDIIKEKSHKFINTVGIKIYYTTKTKTHKIVKLKQKREYTYSDTSTGIKISALVGHDLLKNQKTDEMKKNFADTIWEHLKNSNSKFSQKLADNMDADWPSITVEIPLGSLPVGVIIRVKPVLDVSFGLYGSADATFWLSRSITTTDIINGNKKVDKNEKKNPLSNSLDLNAAGTFSAAGGAELFVGVGKKLLSGEALAGGIRLQATVNLDFSISTEMLSNCQLATSNDGLRITGKGEIGGAFLTGGWFGDIHFLTHEFTWWDGWTKTFNPRMEFDKTIHTVEKEDDNGNYYEQTINYKFTDLGCHVTNPWWLTSWTPMIAVYKNEPDEDEDYEKCEVVRAKSFKAGTKLKKDNIYEFSYKNRTDKEVYVVPGLINSYGRMTLFPAYTTVMKPAPVPTIEYETIEHLDANFKWDGSYEYLYQTKGKLYAHTPTGDVHLYQFGLPFTLRDAAYIDEYWEDWGVYYNIKDPLTGLNKSRYVSLKNSITTSGKYSIKGTFYSNFSYDIDVEAYLWCKEKATGLRIRLDNYDARAYTFKVYKEKKSGKGEIWLNKHLKLEPEIEDFTLSNEFSSVKFPIK